MVIRGVMLIRGVSKGKLKVFSPPVSYYFGWGKSGKRENLGKFYVKTDSMNPFEQYPRYASGGEQALPK